MNLGHMLTFLIVLTGAAALYQAQHELPPEPHRVVVCDGQCYWITLDDDTRCRVFPGEHIRNAEYPILCEVNDRTVPYESYKASRD